MTRQEMLKCLDNNKEQFKVCSFMWRMASLSDKKREETWKWLESLDFKNEDDFIWWIRFNVSSAF